MVEGKPKTRARSRTPSSRRHRSADRAHGPQRAVARRIAEGKVREADPARRRRREIRRREWRLRRASSARSMASAARRECGGCRSASALGSRLSALGSRLSALGSRLSALGSRLSALGSRLSALGSRLSALGSRLSALGSLIFLLPPLLAVPPVTEMSRNIGRRPPAAAPAAQAQDMPEPFWPALMPISVLPVSYAATPGGYDQLQTKRSTVGCYRKLNNLSVSSSAIFVPK